MLKKITNGEVDGRIVTRDGKSVRIICFDKKGDNLSIIALIEISHEVEDYFSFDIKGNYDTYENNSKDLFIEIPEYMTFKDEDVIAYDKFDTISITMADIKHEGKDAFAHYYVELRNGQLEFNKVNTRDIPSIGARIATELEKQKLINALKSSEDPKAKEYLKRFFGIEKKKEYKFKPFDKVLVRDSESTKWKIDIFREFIEYEGNEGYKYNYFYDNWNYCIPYNKETTHLLGTTENYEY